MNREQELRAFLDACTEAEREWIFRFLRQRYPLHPIEQKFGASAEVILEAIARAGDLTQRGIRGIIAEAAFKQHVVAGLQGWEDVTLAGDNSYDFLVRRGATDIRIQVKMQRLKAHQPMHANEAYRRLDPLKYVVETQRTRGGLDKSTNRNTRPYRFGEFDILAVSMHPSTGDWKRFLYTVASWLLPDESDPAQMLKFQPVPAEPDAEWCGDLSTCIEWFLSGEGKRISG